MNPKNGTKSKFALGRLIYLSEVIKRDTNIRMHTNYTNPLYSYH